MRRGWGGGVLGPTLLDRIALQELPRRAVLGVEEAKPAQVWRQTRERTEPRQALPREDGLFNWGAAVSFRNLILVPELKQFPINFLLLTGSHEFPFNQSQLSYQQSS